MLPQKLSWDLAQTQWAQQINPLISNPLTQGNLLYNISLETGLNSINHKLSRKPQGYLIIGMHNAYAQIYDTVSQQPNLTLILNASAPVVVDLYVF